MRSYLTAALLAASTWLCNEAAAQTPDPAVAQQAMARLGFMVGRWEGEAWQLRGNERMKTRMTETVEAKLGGSVLLVEGLGTMSVPGDENRIVHHALGVISFDPATRTYSLRSWLANGQSGEFVLTLGDQEVSWTRPAPSGKVRNTAKFSADEWHETGEFSRDGAAWTQIMELRLRRVR